MSRRLHPETNAPHTENRDPSQPCSFVLTLKSADHAVCIIFISNKKFERKMSINFARLLQIIGLHMQVFFIHLKVVGRGGETQLQVP